MAHIEMSCNRCGAKYEGQSVTEALAWSGAHDEHCPNYRTEVTP